MPTTWPAHQSATREWGCRTSRIAIVRRYNGSSIALPHLRGQKSFWAFSPRTRPRGFPQIWTVSMSQRSNGAIHPCSQLSYYAIVVADLWPKIGELWAKLKSAFYIGICMSLLPRFCLFIVWSQWRDGMCRGCIQPSSPRSAAWWRSDQWLIFRFGIRFRIFFDSFWLSLRRAGQDDPEGAGRIFYR